MVGIDTEADDVGHYLEMAIYIIGVHESAAFLGHSTVPSWANAQHLRTRRLIDRRRGNSCASPPRLRTSLPPVLGGGEATYRRPHSRCAWAPQAVRTTRRNSLSKLEGIIPACPHLPECHTASSETSPAALPYRYSCGSKRVYQTRLLCRLKAHDGGRNGS